jgi:hypothetical protein
MKNLPATQQRALDGEIIPPPDQWRDQEDRYGVGDYVTRCGTDVHQVVSFNEPDGHCGEFLCVKAPLAQPTEDPWIKVGETENNLSRRYSPVVWKPGMEFPEEIDRHPPKEAVMRERRG